MTFLSKTFVQLVPCLFVYHHIGEDVFQVLLHFFFSTLVVALLPPKVAKTLGQGSRVCLNPGLGNGLLRVVDSVSNPTREMKTEVPHATCLCRLKIPHEWSMLFLQNSVLWDPWWKTNSHLRPLFWNCHFTFSCEWASDQRPRTPLPNLPLLDF